MSNFEINKTDRLTVKGLDLTDKDTFFAYRTKPEVYAYQFWKPKSINEIEEFINENLEVLFNTKNTWLQIGLHQINVR